MRTTQTRVSLATRMTRPLRVLALSSLFPNSAQPARGIFLEHRLTHLANLSGVQVHVVAPVPYFPSDRSCFGRYAQFARVPNAAQRQNLPVIYPRYLVIPKCGMAMAPLLMAAFMLPVLSELRTRFDFDVIDSYVLYPDGVAATALGWLLRKPVLLTAIGSDVSQYPKYVLPRTAILWATRHAGHTTAVCQALTGC